MARSTYLVNLNNVSMLSWLRGRQAWLVVSFRKEVSMSVIFYQLNYKFNAFSNGLDFWSLGLLFIILLSMTHYY